MLAGQGGLAVVGDAALILFGNAEQHADHPHRHLLTEVVDEVELAGARRADPGSVR